MEQEGGAQRTSSTSSSDSSFLAEREERVRARTQATRHADEADADQMRQIVFGTRAMSLGSNGQPTSATSSHLLQQSQLSPFWRSSQQSEEPQQAGYRNGFSYGFSHNYSMSGGQQMADGSFGPTTSPFSPNNHSSQYGGQQQRSEGGYRDSFSSFSLNDAFLSDGRQQMAEGGHGQSTSPLSRNNHSSQYEGQQQMADFGGASLRSPGRFGSSADWTPPPPLPTRDFPTASRHTDPAPSIELVPDHPPTSLPIEFPRARGPALFASSASYASPSAHARPRQLPDRVLQPQPLLQLQMYPGGGPPFAAMFVASAPMVNVSCRTGRITMAPPPSPTDGGHFFVNSLLPPHVVRAHLLRNQTAPPARRARPSTSSQSSSHRRNSSSSNDSSSRGSSGNATECNYCLSVGKPHHGHNKYNCPILADLPPCRICNASGRNNHTESHCPHTAKIELDFVPKEQRRRNHTI